MTDDSTLAGYLTRHERAPAFEGSDGRAYSAAIYTPDEPEADGRYGAALLFVRWTPAGNAPDGHVETDFVAYGSTAEDAAAEAGALTLHRVKELLDAAIERHRGISDW